MAKNTVKTKAGGTIRVRELLDVGDMAGDPADTPVVQVTRLDVRGNVLAQIGTDDLVSALRRVTDEKVKPKDTKP